MGCAYSPTQIFGEIEGSDCGNEELEKQNDGDTYEESGLGRLPGGSGQIVELELGDYRLKPGEWLEKYILALQAPSRNEFQARAKKFTRFQQLYYKQNYDALIRKAFTAAQDTVRHWPFERCAQNALVNRDVYELYHNAGSPENSADIVERICMENGILVDSLLENVVEVFNRSVPKKNCIVFMRLS